MALNTAKAIEVLYENAIEEYQVRTHMLKLIDSFTPDPGDFQNANNIIWRPVEQHAPIKRGWDLTGQFGDVIEQYYPSTLEQPANDAFQLRADNMRDQRFWERRGRASGIKQALFLNEQVARVIVNTGSLFYRQVAQAEGFDFMSEADSIMAERQVSQDDRYFVLNSRDNNTFAADLANRGTLVDRPEEAYAMGYLGRNVAGFDAYTGNYISTLVGGVTPSGITVTGNQTFRPEGSTGTAPNTTNVDYRRAVIAISDSSDFNVGDRIQFTNTAAVNGSTNVLAIGLGDKTISRTAMTFVVVEKPSATSIAVWPKPIALNDTTNLDADELAYANVNTIIANGATVTRLNTDAIAHPNIFWAYDSIEVIGGDAPISMLQNFAGMNVMSETMENGQIMYLVYDGTIENLTFRARLFTWWGIVNKRPMANGIAIRAPS